MHMAFPARGSHVLPPLYRRAIPASLLKSHHRVALLSTLFVNDVFLAKRVYTSPTASLCSVFRNFATVFILINPPGKETRASFVNDAVVANVRPKLAFRSGPTFRTFVCVYTDLLPYIFASGKMRTEA